ncbi:hypothetical protein Glove_35g41 [Diversispora epigaea]|uniref:Uncharacterized protein n=1 Tax=Diversispora epigaea TaxID=1348612 RepID=A0A397JIN4_9GLOM|nr:hypothetical protein Glove_35g41 [Diversispora epigaea]
MYRSDFELDDNDFLDIVGDEAFHRRLIKCIEKWPKLRPLLGAWHTFKDFCSALLVLFSSYGILNFARELGVRFLDKLEANVDYPHRIGIRNGNHNLQSNCLASAAPLFASAGKHNYTTAIAHHLSTLAKYPKLNQKLQEVGVFKLIPNNENSHICFAFDEALETFGVRFIKQNITGNIINEETLKRNIKAAQSERERVDLLLSKYLEDTSVSHSQRAINSRKEVLWKLVNNLIIIFDMKNPLEHPIFREHIPPELNKESCEKLIACYPNGLERIQKVYLQEVLKTEKCDPTGRRAIGVKRTKHQEYKEMSKTKKQKVIQQPSDLAESHDHPLKKRRATPHKEQILSSLLVYTDKIPDYKYENILQQLGSDWNKKKIYAWWNYRNKKNTQKQVQLKS